MRSRSRRPDHIRVRLDYRGVRHGGTPVWCTSKAIRNQAVDLLFDMSRSMEGGPVHLLTKVIASLQFTLNNCALAGRGKIGEFSR
jgi:hypothetical protein